MVGTFTTQDECGDSMPPAGSERALRGQKHPPFGPCRPTATHLTSACTWTPDQTHQTSCLLIQFDKETELEPSLLARLIAPSRS